MGDYKKVDIKPPKAAGTRKKTKEEIYWGQFKSPLNIQCAGPVNSIEFCPVAPYDFAVTSGTRVQIFSSVTKTEKVSISRFKDIAYGASFRSDGHLLAVGGEEKAIRVFETASKNMLRMFKGHERAVHVSKFCSDNQKIISGSDDATVRVWDLATEEAIQVMKGHEDYIRCCVESPASMQLWVSGSYDHSVRLWDFRDCKSVMQINHDHPVESVLFYGNGGYLVSAGSNVVKIWDVLAGGKLVQTLTNHTKTVTCLGLDGSGMRLLTGGLDHMLKVIDTRDFSVSASLDVQEPVISMGLAKDNNTLAVGTASGQLTIRQRKHKKIFLDQAEKQKKKQLMIGSYRFFMRGGSSSLSADDFRVRAKDRDVLATYDVMLKKFDYAAALDMALKVKDPFVVSSVLDALIKRDALRQSLFGRDAPELEPILLFLSKFISDPRFSSLLVDVAEVVFDLYVGVLGRSDKVDQLFVKIQARMREELAFQQKLMELQGSLEILMCGSCSAANEVLI